MHNPLQYQEIMTSNQKENRNMDQTFQRKEKKREEKKTHTAKEFCQIFPIYLVHKRVLNDFRQLG